MSYILATPTTVTIKAYQTKSDVALKQDHPILFWTTHIEDVDFRHAVTIGAYQSRRIRTLKQDHQIQYRENIYGLEAVTLVA